MFGKGSETICRSNDSGNASRFFKSIIYQAKASKSERNEGLEGFEEKNIHPTVKPVALMEYLIKMVTPTNGIVLDPFMGSGSTGVACVLNDFEFVGIDLDKDYCEIARARIEGVKETQTKMF
jgi:site-specific DNA-methyltransferase (adenine-specific)